jgi:hypothetical protein
VLLTFSAGGDDEGGGAGGAGGGGGGLDVAVILGVPAPGLSEHCGGPVALHEPPAWIRYVVPAVDEKLSED